MLTSCSYEITVADISSLIGTTWNFNDNTSYQFDENYVEIVNGRAQLKTLDLEHSGDDFNSGTDVGSSYLSGGVALLKNTVNKDIRQILPLRVDQVVGYWKFDSDIFTDRSSNGFNFTTGSGNPQHIDGGRVSKAINLDGDDHLEVSDDDKLDLAQHSFSIGMWVNTISSTNQKYLTKRDIGGGASGNGLGWGFGINNGNFSLYTNNGLSNEFGSNTIQTNDGIWHHLVAVYDHEKSEKRYYVDGVLDNTINTLVYAGVSTAALNLGNRAGASHVLGSIDELFILNFALSGSEIKKIFDEQNVTLSDETELSVSWTPKWSSIVGYWKMDGNWQDSSGNGNHCSPINTPVLLNINSKVGSGQSQFNGVDQSCDVGSGMQDFNGSDEFSVLFWAQYNQTATDYILGTLYNTGWSLRINNSSAGNTLLVKVDDGVNNYASSGQTDLNDNAWHQIGLIKKTDRLLGYVDGRIEIDVPISTLNDLNDDFNIGRLGGSYFPGNLDDLAVWSTGLNKNEVLEIYNRQKQKYAGSYDSEVIDLGSVTSNWPDLSWSTNLPFGKELVGDFDNDGNPDSESSSDYSALSVSLDSDLISYWNFNEPTLGSAPGGFDFKDNSYNSNHLTYYGTELSTPGILGSTFGSSAAEAGDIFNFTGTSSFSLSMWVNTEQLSTGSYYIPITNRSSDSGGQQGYTCFLRETDYKFSCQRYVNGSGYGGYSGNPLEFGRWYHIVYSYDGGKSILYINGEPEAPFPDTNSLANVPGSKLRLGDWSKPGRLDEVAIWDRALGVNEIQQLYRRGANRVKLQVKSCVDSSCNCKSYGAGGSETDCDGDTIANALDNDDEHKADFIGPGGDGTTYYSELYNRSETDITFQCALNTTDSHPGICVPDEITLAGSPKPTGPEFLDIDYTQFVKPQNNRYAQYRVYMEADENTACGGEPCLPELTSVSLNPSGTPRYFGGPQVIKPLKPQPYRSLDRIVVDADSCVKFQLSPNDIQYYWWDGSTWSLASDDTLHLSTKEDVQNQIRAFSSQIGPGNLHIKAFLSTSADQTANCSIGDFDVFYK